MKTGGQYDFRSRIYEPESGKTTRDTMRVCVQCLCVARLRRRPADPMWTEWGQMTNHFVIFGNLEANFKVKKVADRLGG